MLWRIAKESGLSLAAKQAVPKRALCCRNLGLGPAAKTASDALRQVPLFELPHSTCASLELSILVSVHEVNTVGVVEIELLA